MKARFGEDLGDLGDKWKVGYWLLSLLFVAEFQLFLVAFVKVFVYASALAHKLIKMICVSQMPKSGNN